MQSTSSSPCEMSSALADATTDATSTAPAPLPPAASSSSSSSSSRWPPLTEPASNSTIREWAPSAAAPAAAFRPANQQSITFRMPWGEEVTELWPQNDAEPGDCSLPKHNVSRIMAGALPPGAKISEDAKAFMQDIVTELISGSAFAAAHHSEQRGSRKPIAPGDLIKALREIMPPDFMPPLLERQHRREQQQQQQQEEPAQEEASRPQVGQGLGPMSSSSSTMLLTAEAAASEAAASKEEDAAVPWTGGRGTDGSGARGKRPRCADTYSA